MGKGSKKGSLPKESGSAAERAVAAAYEALPATLAALAPFAVHKASGVQLQFADASALSAERVAWVMQTLKTNMEPVFGAREWPAQERTRRRDATAAEARYLFAHATPAEPGEAGASPPASPPPPLGFVHYRFLVEEEVPVLYVYELQVTGACFPPRRQLLRRLTAAPACRAEAARGKGLGKYLMLFAEMLAKRSPGPLGGVVLTIQRVNTRALQFYTTKCKYALADISPSRSDPFAAQDEYDYEIYARLFTEDAERTFKRAGDAARLENAMHAEM